MQAATRAEFDGAVAAVIGGSGTIGRAVCRRLAAAGSRVAVGYFTSIDSALEIRNELDPQEKGLAEAIQVDVRDEDSVDRFFSTAGSRLGPLSVVIHCAGGLCQRSPVETMPLTLWTRVIELNLTGAFISAKAAARHLAGRNGAITILASSAMATGGSGGSVHYAAAKAGLTGLIRGLAREVAPHIRVNGVAPAAVPGGFHDQVPPATPIDSWPLAIPLGRNADPDDIASVAVFLSSVEAAYVTGQTWHVNGGLIFN